MCMYVCVLARITVNGAATALHFFALLCQLTQSSHSHRHTHTHACTCMYVCVLHSSCDLIPIPFVAVAVCFHFRPSLSLAKESERGLGKGRVGQAGLAASRSHTKLLHTTMFTMCDKRCRKKKIHKLLANLLLLLSLPPSSSTSTTPTTLSLFRCLSFVMVAILAHYVIHQGTAGAAVAVDVAAKVDVPLLHICL